MITWAKATDAVVEAICQLRDRPSMAQRLDYLESEGLWDTQTVRYLAGLYRSKRPAMREPALALVHMMHMIHSAKLTGDERAYGAREWLIRNRVVRYEWLKSLINGPFDPDPSKGQLEALVRLASFYSVHPEVFGAHVAVLFEGERSVMITDDGLYYPPSGRSTAVGVLAETGKPLAMTEYLISWMTQRYKRQEWEEDPLVG